MESDVREVGSCHLEDVVGVGQEHVAAIAVSGHELVFAALEIGQGLFVVALNPACLEQRYGFPTALCAVFMEQTVLDDFKLKLTHGADDFAAVELVGEQLGHAFVH